MIFLSDDLNKEDRYIRMRAKRDGECSECEDELLEDDEIIWDTKEFKAYCLNCGEEL